MCGFMCPLYLPKKLCKYTSENFRKSKVLMEPIKSYPLRDLHNLAYDNVNPAIVNEYVMSSMFARLQI